MNYLFMLCHFTICIRKVVRRLHDTIHVLSLILHGRSITFRHDFDITRVHGLFPTPPYIHYLAPLMRVPQKEYYHMVQSTFWIRIMMLEMVFSTHIRCVLRNPFLALHTIWTNMGLINTFTKLVQLHPNLQGVLYKYMAKRRGDLHTKSGTGDKMEAKNYFSMKTYPLWGYLFKRTHSFGRPFLETHILCGTIWDIYILYGTIWKNLILYATF